MNNTLMDGLSGSGMIIIAIIGVLIFVAVIAVVVIVAWYISTSNRFNKMIVKIDEAESGIDVALTKRFDMLTKLFQVTKGYAKHEMDTLKAVIAMRQPASTAPMSEKQDFSNAVSEGFKQINIVAEKYPELQANSNFAKLMDAVSEVEDHLQASRRLYNSNISQYNQYLVSFPSSFVGNRKGLTKRDFFEAEESKRKDVNLEF